MADKSLISAYLMNGADQLKREFLVKRLTSRIQAYGDLDFNKDSFVGPSASAEQVITACNTMPFMSEYRMVVVSDVDKAPKDVAEALVAYLANPCPTTVLALTATKLAKNTRLYKAVAAVDKKAIVDCSPKSAKDLPNQVRDLALSNGIDIQPAAASRLIALLGDSTVHLDSELKKMASALGRGAMVTVDDVNRLVAAITEPKPWEFVDALSGRDVTAALSLLAAISSTSPFALLTMAVARIRELMMAKELGGGAALASALGLPEWRVRNHGRWAARFTSAELSAALVAAARTEGAMKSGQDRDQAFEQWVIKVCTGSF